MIPELRIVSPCAADWNAMTPTTVGRHCAACGKDVVDLTCLSPLERTAALERITRDIVGGRQVCVRASATSDGWLTYRRLLTNGIAAMLAMTFSGCQGEGPPVASSPAQASTPTSILPKAPTPSQASTSTLSVAPMHEILELQPEPDVLEIENLQIEVHGGTTIMGAIGVPRSESQIAPPTSLGAPVEGPQSPG